MQEKLTIGKEFKEALKTMNDSNDHLFLTGRAGTGKSTLLTYFRKHTTKKHVVLAPTGVAALNVKGQTIHSFFGFHPAITPNLVRKAFPNSLPLFKTIETIIIDEISMVRADLLDCIDRALRLNRDRPKEPFGGVQMIFIGDLYQLPPVVTSDETYRFQTEYTSPYFFSAYVMEDIHPTIIELKKVHRQKEKAFVQLLDNLRTNTLDPSDVEEWNTRHDPYFDPREETGYIHLTTTNKMAQARNDYELKQLEGKEWKLMANSMGELPDRRMPSEPSICVKEGARVMFTMNDPERRWVNGTLGTITRIKTKGLAKIPILEVDLEDGRSVVVEQHKWEMFEYTPGEEGSIEEAVVGSYIQYPITLAWAVTIHKGQGKTFDHVLVDIGWGAFAHGQLYVALSRCTTFRGLVLLKPFRTKDIILDQAVVDFMKKA
ncbi:AAA family ATPase [Candidatus Uhrbacteria bacterium]|nr:AAA family ATPase [Candidatus Uhrbacteria bacterium]